MGGLDIGRYASAAGLVALAVAVGWLAGPALGAASLAMLLLAPVLASGVWLGLRPALLAALLAAVSLNVFFMEPRFSLAIVRPADFVTFAVFFLAALATGGLAGRVREAARRAEAKAAELSALLDDRDALNQAEAENAALRRADELRAALVNSVSHDFRTPLSTVLGSATTLIEFEDSLSPKVRRDLLASIRDEADRLNRSIGDLLDLARLEAGALQPREDWVDVRAVIGSIIERLGGRPVARDFPAQLSKLKSDPVLLEQAIGNLVENAIRHAEGARIEIAAYEDAADLVIAVEDDGPGIPPGRLPQVFDRFQGEGVGLGLAIAKGLTEALGGRIAAVSPIRDGRGTRMLIAIPKAHRTPEGLL